MVTSSSKNTKTYLKIKNKRIRYENVKCADVLRPFSLQIAITVAKARNRRGLTQRQLAKVAHVPQSTISYLESGWANVTLLNLIKVAHFLEIPMVKLFEDSRKTLKIFSSQEVERFEKDQWQKGFHVSEISLENNDFKVIAVPEYKQLTVKVLQGEVHIRADYLNAIRMVKETETAVLPGGGDIKIFVVGCDSAVKIFMVEGPIGEGRQSY